MPEHHRPTRSAFGLGLREAQIRRAITRLEDLGLIERARVPAFQRDKERRLVPW